MRLVKYETGLPLLLSQTKQTQITRTAEMGGFCFFAAWVVCLEEFFFFFKWGSFHVLFS